MRKYTRFIGVFLISLSIENIAFAHHHHHHELPPPPPPKADYSLNPKQTKAESVDLTSSVANRVKKEQAAEEVNKNDNAPALLLPNHYTHAKEKRLNGNNGWVASKHSKGKYDIGINAPISQTGDPSGSKTRNVFRRAVPVYEPNY